MKYKRTTHANVYRAVDRENYVNGYLAKVIRRDARLHKMFQIAKHGHDRQRALRAAVRAVRSFVREHPKMTRTEIAELRRTKKDRDLPVGIRRVRHKVGSRIYRYFEAEWSPRPNQQKKKRFSVNLYGEAEALQLALLARAEGLSSMKT
jgi:hypothetical protein